MAVLILPSLTSLPIDLLSRRTLKLKHLPSRNYLYFSSSSPLHHFSPKPHLSLRRSPITFFNAQKIFALRSLSASTSFQFEFSKQQPWPQSLLRVFASVLLIFGLNFSFAARVCYASSIQFPPLLATQSSVVPEEQTTQDDHDGTKSEGWKNIEEKKLHAAFETWKSKTYALTVPLTVVALRGSIPPSWVKDFIQSQGRRSRFQLKLNGSLEGIFSELSVALGKGNVRSSSVVAADLVSIGDSWLNYAIKKAIIQPIEGVEDQDWFRSLSNKWKVYLCRNSEGNIDPDGKMWAAPYRWGCMVIAYKKSKFQKYNLAPIEDWADLWRPELTGRISMVESPREVVGAVLKYMGASYNTNDISSQVSGGKDSVQQNLALLAKQVRLFDNTQYLKAFGVGEVWVAVGWSSDVLPVAKRMSNVAVVVPKSGASLWADLWVIPAASRLKTNQIGGRVRGPSPLIHQWIEFCLQAARSIPFKQEVIPGSSPSALESAPVELPRERNKGKPRLDTNLVEGVPPTDILVKCEFLEPLSDSSLSDYQWLISAIKKSDHGVVYKLHCYISSLIQNFRLKLHPKLT